MREICEAEAVADGGITANLKVHPKRGITLLAKEQWRAAMLELGAELPWHTRRANVLVEGLDLEGLIGRRVLLGGVELLIGGETTPCAMMDKQYEGLKAALAPECRAGVYGRVVQGGRFRVGDTVGPA
jgi:MOSC domain-containing protein YiiM